MDHFVREQLNSLLQKHVPEASIRWDGSYSTCLTKEQISINIQSGIKAAKVIKLAINSTCWTNFSARTWLLCPLCSALDDVVLDYVVEVLTNLGDADENSFDVDQLCEMIAAYVPEFAQVDRCETRCHVCTLQYDKIYNWYFWNKGSYFSIVPRQDLSII